MPLTGRLISFMTGTAEVTLHGRLMNCQTPVIGIVIQDHGQIKIGSATVMYPLTDTSCASRSCIPT